MSEKYIHTEGIHNLKDPQEIIPVMMKIINPASVVDIGCGLGTFLYSFKQAGVKDVLGIDGTWVNRTALEKYLSENEFLEKDLEKPFSLEKKYDLVLSLEVAEHLSPEAADIFVQNLVNAGQTIVFSAAIPLQGGQHHINEQWIPYWEEKFSRQGYVMHDVIRPIFWDNPNVLSWYKQNMVLFAKKDFTVDPSLVRNPLKNVVHPELFNHIASERELAFNGGLYPHQYVSFLYMAVIRIIKTRIFGKRK
jgi:SAM-dependent methyltransferase